MRKKRLQNHVAGSVFTLPVCAVIAVLVWWLPLGQYNVSYAIGLGLATLIAFVLLETNNRFQLIRVRSRIVASAWVLCAACIASLHEWHHGTIVALCLAIAHFFLFSSYEKRQPVNDSFHTGLFLGIGTLFIPWIVVFLPLFQLHQAVYLRSQTLRCFFATIIGCIFPALLVTAPMVFTQDYSRCIQWYDMLMSVSYIAPENYLALTLQQVLSWLLPCLLILLGGIHYLCTSYDDRISVRMMLYILFTDALVILLFSALQPQYAELLIPAMLVCGCVFIGHFFALTKSWFTNFLFILSLMCLAGVGYLTLWNADIPMKKVVSLFAIPQKQRPVPHHKVKPQKPQKPAPVIAKDSDSLTVPVYEMIERRSIDTIDYQGMDSVMLQPQETDDYQPIEIRTTQDSLTKDSLKI